ncbi:hypothetical protein FC86_GL000594 [Holzapfeliella floricola DSM 23037 = JCM 16512]|uniref:Abortive infection protein-like C-terminal domain-containing protein n=2 Tax=Holzapfeliella TaxID=2767883 RepID=A0A0R2DIZ7_9LACO|nr:hypothetical protein FC86_GL000594 [Holzapfeliella floricola DSM 23037 = JCM 16512]
MEVLDTAIFNNEISPTENYVSIILYSDISSYKLIDFSLELLKVVEQDCLEDIGWNNQYYELNNVKEILHYYQKQTSIFEKLEKHDILKIEFIEKLVNNMFENAEENPEEAIGKAKELLESVMKTILDNERVTYSNNIDMKKLLKKISNLLKLSADSISQKELPQELQKCAFGVISGLNQSINGIIELRNKFGSGHGKSAKNKPAIPPRYAHLVIGSTYTAVTFLLETYDYVFQNKRQS